MPTLTDLPTELVERIAEQAHPTTILALRLVYKDTADKIHRTFLQVNCGERSLLLTSRSSLRAGFDIASNTLFGPPIKKLVLLVDQSDGERGRDCTWGRMDKMRKLPGQVSAMRKKDDFTPLLASVFGRLRKYGNIEEIVLTTMEVPTEGTPWERKTVSPPDVPRTWDKDKMRSPSTDRPFEVIVTALDISGLVVPKLTMRTKVENSRAWDESWALCADLSRSALSAIPEAFYGLRELDLKLDEHDWQVPSFSKFFGLLAALPALAVLKLSTANEQDLRWYDYEDTILPPSPILCMIARHVFPSLAALTLEYAYISLALLSAFAHRQPKMQKLRIQLSRIVDEQGLGAEGQKVEEVVTNMSDKVDVSVDEKSLWVPRKF